MAIQSINPATGKVMEIFEEWPQEKTAQAIAETDAAWKAWRQTPLSRREDCLRGAAAALRQNRDEYARLMALEMGKPITEGRAEIDKCALVCDYYAENGARYLAMEPVDTEGSSAYVAFRPLGVVLAVMPWNFPFWQVFRFAAPALMAGNCVLLKHSSNVPRCGQAIETLFARGGFPEGVFRTLMIGSGQVEAVVANPHVKGVTLTGSAEAGRRVAAAAGRLMKKSVMELGGSDPFIVLEDADLELAAQTAARARCINSGQSCIAAKRFIVEDTVFLPFMQRFSKAMAALVVGDPLEEATQVGPLAREDLVQDLHAQLRASVAMGAEIVLGGKPLEREGFFFPPTILAGVKPGMRAYSEELFGPVASVIRVQDPDHALEVANDTIFGLGSSVWTRDRRKGEEIAARLDAGVVFINGMTKSDPRLPFGGVKGSGFGRELSHFGIREFVNIQTVWVR